MHGIDAGTGETLWLHPGDFGSAPGVGDGVLFIQSWLTMGAVDLESGWLRWSSTRDSVTGHAPVVDDGVVDFGSDGDAI